MNGDNEIYHHYLFGIGKGGIKAVSYIEKNWNNINCDSIKYVISDTDEVILNQSSIKNKVLLSNKYKLLDIDKEKLIEHTTNRTLIYLFAGAGGDIGEYLLYDICMTFQKSSPFTINFLSIPFDFEGHEKIENAKQIATKITNECGRVVTIDSQQILLSKPDLYLSDCFSELHKVQYQLFWNSVRCFPAYGYICIDLSDLLYIPYSSKKLCTGFGGANGKNRVEKAFKDARKFLFQEIEQHEINAYYVMFHSSTTIRLTEEDIDDLNKLIRKESESIICIIGAIFNEHVKSEIEMYVIAGDLAYQ